jgi:hypothetical protein
MTSERLLFQSCLFLFDVVTSVISRLENILNITNQSLSTSAKRSLSDSSNASTMDAYKRFRSSENNDSLKAKQKLNETQIKTACLNRINRPFYINDRLSENCERLVEYALLSSKDSASLVDFSYWVAILDRNHVESIDLSDLKTVCVNFIQNYPDNADIFNDLVRRLEAVSYSNGRCMIKNYRADLFINKVLIPIENIHNFQLFFAFFNGTYSEFKNIVDEFVKVFDVLPSPNKQV